MNPTGLTADAGWQAGLRRTVPHPLPVVWARLLSDLQPLWLGVTDAALRAGEPYRTADGTRGEVRSLAAERRIRLTWQPAGRAEAATLQVTVLPAASGTTIALHAERLEDSVDRERMLERFAAIQDRLRLAL